MHNCNICIRIVEGALQFLFLSSAKFLEFLLQCNSAQEALKRLDMFQNLKVLKTTPLSGDDRQEFARTFIRHCVCDRLVGGEGKFGPSWDIDLKIPTGQGDIRVLVRELRALSLLIGRDRQDL